MNMPNQTPRLVALTLLLGLAVVVLTQPGCTHLHASKRHRATSVVSFLYPGKDRPLADQRIPVLKLPLRVGIGFVPGKGRESIETLPESQKQQLLKRVAAEFKPYPFVEAIELIPSMYFREGGGFENLEQIRTMLGIDVIALVAYDQMQFTDSDWTSLAYWTIVGAYVVQGNRNDSHTLMEAAVYDIESRRLLFRAPGASRIKARTTMVDVARVLREDGARGFDEATAEMIVNLKAQLAEFRERAKNPSGEVQIVHKPGYTGGGALPVGFAVAIGLVMLARTVGCGCPKRGVDRCARLD